MELFILICELIAAIAGVLPAIVSVVCLIKNIIETKNWDLITKIAQEAMTSVEEYAIKHPEMTSEDKLNMAIAAVESGCEAAGIKLDGDLIKKIVAYIEELCKWSKTVNCNCI